MLVALIDDGIDTITYPHLSVQYDLCVEENGTIRTRGTQESIITDHGTTCAEIISKYAPNVEFCSLRIFDAIVYSTDNKIKLHTSCNRLIAALKWCYDYNIPIVHISAGSCLLSDHDEIHSIIAKMIGKKQVIVAAHSNRDNYSIPACLSGVFGVIADPYMTGDEYAFSFQQSGNWTIYASSAHRFTMPSGYERTTQITNSYAAPTVTAAIHNILARYSPFSLSVAQLFRMVAETVAQPKWAKPDFIEKAYIVNRSGKNVLKNHLFFKCLGEYTSFSDWKRNAMQKYDLVYLAPSDSSRHDDDVFLKENEVLYAGLLYGGIISEDFQNQRRTGLIWSENLSSNFWWRDISMYYKNNCPIVYICGAEDDAVDMLCQLRKLSFEHGYQCAGISDQAYSYLYGLEHVSDEQYQAKVIRNVVRLYSPDVILCNLAWVSNTDKFSPSAKCVYISFENETSNSRLEPITADFAKEDVRLLYKKIACTIFKRNPHE